MTLRTIARRYAVALFDVVSTSGDPAAVGRALESFHAIVDAHPDLRKALASPAVPAARKVAVINGMFDAAGEPQSPLRRTLVLLAENDRLGVLGDVVECYLERLREAQRIVPAEVVTAEPLPAERRGVLAEALGRAVGAEVTMAERVDPAIIGGMVARLGSVVYDASVARQLARIRQRLMDGR